MSEEATATVEFSDSTKELGDKIVGMTLKEAKELSDYLEDAHGIKPAAGGGAIVMAGAGDGGDGGTYAFESWFGFFGLFGFFLSFALVLTARGLRKFLMRDEDYYDR